MAAILNSAILDSATLVFPLKLTHTCQDWFPPFAQKRLHSHFPPHHLEKKNFNSFHSDSTWWWQPSEFYHVGLKNFTHSFWLNLMMAVILNSAILDSATLIFPLKLTHTCQDWFPSFAQKRLHSHFPPHHLHKITLLIHSDSTWWWQPSWILPCWIKTSLIHTDSNWLKTSTHSYWLKLMMAAILNSVMLDSDTFLSSLRFTQKPSPTTVTLDSN